MRKPASKFLSLFLVLAMVCSLFGAAFAAEEETATPYVIPDVDGKVVILHTNDTHGADLDEEGTSFGMAGVAQLKKDFEAAGADVLLVSAGDSIMGKPLVSADQGKSAIEFMNAAGYDAMTVGNHELDFGIDNLKALAKDADFPILCADMTTEADGKTVFDSNKIFEIGGVKVGVFGLATPETLTKADASKMPGITFPQTDKLYAVAQAQVDELNKAGADLIVCLGHLGIDDESIGNRSIDVCEHVNGIDLFIDGHSHSTTADIIAKVGDTNVVNGAKIVTGGHDPMWAGTVLSAYMVTVVIAKISLGAIYDRFGLRFGNVLGSVACIVACVALCFPAADLGPIVAAVSFGVGTCMGTITPTIAASKQFGMADLGKVTGTITSLEMVGGTVGAIVSGVLFDATGSFASTWIVCLACSVVMLVFLLVSEPIAAKLRASVAGE